MLRKIIMKNRIYASAFALMLMASFPFSTVYAGEQPEVTKEEADAYLLENGIEIPDDVKAACNKYAEEYSMDPALLEGMAWVESNFETDAKSGSYIGLMQIHKGTHRERAESLGVEDMSSVDGNIHVAADLMSELVKEGKGLDWALDSYNGNKNADIYRKNGTESNYVKKVRNVSAMIKTAGAA